MEFEDDRSGYGGDENIEEMLEDLAVGEEAMKEDLAKKDSTIFAIDCSPEMMATIEGESMSEFQKIMESYANFMMSKIIANAHDKVGLILYNIKAKQNSLNFDRIVTVHELDAPSARTIKSASTVYEDYVVKHGIESSVPLHHVLWLYGHQIKELYLSSYLRDHSKYHLRLFLFTTDDCPHPAGDERRDQAINHARQLAAKNVHIELFPIRKTKKSSFDIRKFYQQILTLDPEEINETVIDSSSKILDLQSRLRQKQFKKRTLNRLLMKIGNETDVGIKMQKLCLFRFSLFSKAKKPLGKKVEATTNKPLKRIIKKLNSKGEALFDEQIGSYYPLGGQKIRVSKPDMNQIKSLEPPGMTLIGFKPRSLIKPYHNIRTSYFLYPDEEHVGGSQQFFDALIEQLSESSQVAIVKIIPRNNQQLRFAALLPQKQSYDPEDHFQTPPGFNMIILPYADDIVNFAGKKTVVKPQKVSSELVQVTKLLINNLTVQDFDLRDFENPSIQKFYGHLQAHALNEPAVDEREDLLLPDKEGINKFKDIIELVKQAAQEEAGNVKQQNACCGDDNEDSDCVVERKKEKKGAKKEVKKEVKKEEPEKKSRVKPQKGSKQEESMMVKENTKQIEAIIVRGQIDNLKVSQLREFLIEKGLSSKGNKQELVDRVMVFMTHQNEI